MTDAMKKKAIQAIEKFRTEIAPGEIVHGYGFHHNDEDYRIEEIAHNEFKLFRCSKTDIYDTLVEIFKI